MIRITDQYFWNFVFTMFFLVMIIMGVIILDSEARIAPGELTVFDISLMVLATFRLIRLFAYDGIAKFFREQFWDAEKTKTGYVLSKPAKGPRRTLADLFGCPWCLGMWFGATVTFFYLWTAYAYLPVLILAISAVASSLQIAVNWIGWSAEKAKRDSGN